MIFLRIDLASSQAESYYIGESPSRRKRMKTLIGLTVAVVIGSCVVAGIMNLYATIQTSLHAAGL
jgi:Tfp pilus assembly protein PilW